MRSVSDGANYSCPEPVRLRALSRQASGEFPGRCAFHVHPRPLAPDPLPGNQGACRAAAVTSCFSTFPSDSAKRTAASAWITVES